MCVASAHCSRHRLVTVLGPGGVGKTNLALEAARVIGDDFSDGVAVARLAGVTEAGQLPDAVMGALDVTDAPTTTAEEQLTGHLRERDLLLVLDNCEHLVDACAVLAEHLLESCPGLRLLATSREPLAARGEVQCAVDPLPVPPPDADGAAMAASTAVQLVDRAQRRCPTSASTRTTPERWARSAGTSTASAGSNWPPPGPACRSISSPTMEDRFALLTNGREPQAGSEPSGRPSTGATTS